MNEEIESVILVMKNGDKITFQLSEETKKEIMEKMSTPEKWKPGTGEIYVYHDEYTIIRKAMWQNDVVDIWLYRNNNVFKTEAEAIKYKKVFEAICEVCEEHPVDWDNKDQEKHWLEWDYSSKEVNYDYEFNYKIPNVKYTSCKDFKEKVLEKGISESDLDWFLMR